MASAMQRPTTEQAAWLKSFTGVDISGFQDNANDGKTAAGATAGAGKDDDQKDDGKIVAVLVSNHAQDETPKTSDQPHASPAARGGGAPGGEGDDGVADDAGGGGDHDAEFMLVAYEPGKQKKKPAGGHATAKPGGKADDAATPVNDPAGRVLSDIDKGADVASKLVKLGSDVIHLMHENTELTTSSNDHTSVVPADAKWTDLLGGVESKEVQYEYTSFLSKVDIKFGVEWLYNVSYKGRGQYIKNATVNLDSARTMFPHKVSVDVQFGEPYQDPKGTPNNPIAMLPVRIVVNDRGSLIVGDQVRTFRGVIKGSGGYEHHGIS